VAQPKGMSTLRQIEYTETPEYTLSLVSANLPRDTPLNLLNNLLNNLLFYTPIDRLEYLPVDLHIYLHVSTLVYLPMYIPENLRVTSWPDHHSPLISCWMYHTRLRASSVGNLQHPVVDLFLVLSWLMRINECIDENINQCIDQRIDMCSDTNIN
jgi:hypothetical protein